MRFARRRWWALGLGAVGVVVLGIVLLVVTVGQVPIPKQIPAPQASRLLAADGSLITTLHGPQDRTLVSLSQISPIFQQAVVSAEDRNFYHEGAFSVRGTLRALVADISAGGAAQGGSTITQQYVRNAFPQVGVSRTIFRKIKELVLAIKIGRKYTKNEILDDYLNTIYFGRGAYGAQAAAQAYFGKDAKDLTLPESAYLAGIIRSPESYQPDQNPKGVVDIVRVVLADMVRDRKVTPSQAAAAESTPLNFSQSVIGPASARAAYFIEYVRRFLIGSAHLTDQDLLTGGLTISTTLSLKAQAAAEKAVSSTLNQPNDPETALVAMDTAGNIRAMVGGRNVTSTARAQGFNFAYQRSGTTGGEQAGSAFKPFTLAAFVQDGFTIRSTFPAPPTIQITSPQCRNADGTPWQVSNYNNESFPSIDVTKATAQSVNTVYAQIVDKLGPKKVVAMAKAAGDFHNLPQVCSITLGTAPVTPLEMARAYATFAGRGQRPVPMAVTKVTTPDGSVLFQAAPHQDMVLDPNVADTVNQVLTQVLINGTAAGKGIGRPAAGKTGTTDHEVAAWFVGYTPNLTAAVWMGFPPDSSGQVLPMSDVHGGPVVGGSLPATIWQKFMTAAVAGTPVTQFVQPTIGGRFAGAQPACGTASPPSGPGSCVQPTNQAPPSPTCGASGLPPCPGTPTPSPSPIPTIVVPPSPSPSPSPPVYYYTPSPSPTPPSPSPTFPTPTPSPTSTRPSPTPA